MSKVYETYKQAEEASSVESLTRQCIDWKRRANQFRDRKKIEFCERRMMNYKALLDAALKSD